MDIGAKLKQARLKKGLTQEQAADAAHVSRQTISNWENGRSLPDILSVTRLADIYGISLDLLVRDGKTAGETIPFLEKNWDALYSAAVATLPLAALAEHFLSVGIAMGLLVLGTFLFALPRILFGQVFGGGVRNVVLGLIGWALVVLRMVWLLSGSQPTLAAWLLALAGLALVLFVRHRERGVRAQTGKWHYWLVTVLILTVNPLIWYSNALKSGDLNTANPFLHIYRIEAVESGSVPEALLVELSYENTLCFLDPRTDSSQTIGQFRYLEPTEAEQETVAGIWQLVPEGHPEELYRLTVGADGKIRLSLLKNEELTWRYQLTRADTLRWSAGTKGQSSAGPMEWYPAQTFSGNLENLNHGTITGSGTVAFISEEPVTQLTVTERRYHNGAEETRTMVLQPNDSGSFTLELETRYPGQEYGLYSIPWADGDYWFWVEFQ